MNIQNTHVLAAEIIFLPHHKLLPKQKLPPNLIPPKFLGGQSN